MNNKLKEAIEKSGNNLHETIVKKLEELLWETEVSAYYYDDTQEIPREIDIIARKKEYINSEDDFFEVFLLIECKYFLKQVCFRKIDNKKKHLSPKVKNISSQLLYEMEENSKFYYQRRNISSLYDIEMQEKGKKAEDFIFKAITQPIKSLIFFRNEWRGRGLFYSICVYSGSESINGIFEINSRGQINRENIVEIRDELDKIEAKKKSLMMVDYSYKEKEGGRIKRENFFVDFIHKDEFEDFLVEEIEPEIKEIGKRLKTEQDQEKRGWATHRKYIREQYE